MQKQHGHIHFIVINGHHIHILSCAAVYYFARNRRINGLAGAHAHGYAGAENVFILLLITFHYGSIAQGIILLNPIAQALGKIFILLVYSLRKRIIDHARNIFIYGVGRQLIIIHRGHSYIPALASVKILPVIDREPVGDVLPRA